MKNPNVSTSILVGLEKGLKGVVTPESWCLSSLATDSSGQLHVLWHDCDTLSMDRAQVGILEQADQVALRGFLQGHDGSALESEVGLEVLSDFTDKALERQLADQQLSGLLVTTDLTESNGTRSVSVRLLDTTSRWG